MKSASRPDPPSPWLGWRWRVSFRGEGDGKGVLGQTDWPLLLGPLLSSSLLFEGFSGAGLRGQLISSED